MKHWSAKRPRPNRCSGQPQIKSCTARVCCGCSLPAAESITKATPSKEGRQENDPFLIDLSTVRKLWHTGSSDLAYHIFRHWSKIDSDGGTFWTTIFKQLSVYVTYDLTSFEIYKCKVTLTLWQNTWLHFWTIFWYSTLKNENQDVPLSFANKFDIRNIWQWWLRSKHDASVQHQAILRSYQLHPPLFEEPVRPALREELLRRITGDFQLSLMRICRLTLMSKPCLFPSWLLNQRTVNVSTSCSGHQKLGSSPAVEQTETDLLVGVSQPLTPPKATSLT